MQKRSISLFAASLLAALVCVPSARADLSSKDKKFVEKAAAGGTMEVTVGKLAAEKATMDDVKKFGQQMVDDHSKANKELKEFAQSKDAAKDLQDGEDKGTKEAQNASVKLSKNNGAAFDKAYIDDMVEDHEKDVKEFDDASKNCEDADLKAWAAKTLPTLQMHLQMAKDLQEKLKKTAQ